MLNHTKLTHMGGISGPNGLYSVSHYKGTNSQGEQFFHFDYWFNQKHHHDCTSTDLDALYRDEEKFLDFARKQRPAFEITAHKTNFGAVIQMGWK